MISREIIFALRNSAIIGFFSGVIVMMIMPITAYKVYVLIALLSASLTVGIHYGMKFDKKLDFFNDFDFGDDDSNYLKHKVKVIIGILCVIIFFMSASLSFELFKYFYPRIP